MSLEDRLQAKAGPLPVWAWGGIIGVLAVAYMYYRSSHAAAAAASGGTNATTTDPATAGSTDAIDGAFAPGTANGSPLPSDQTDSTDTTSTQPTNDSWLSQGVAYLAGHGVSPLNAQRNLSDYLNGVTLTANQAASITPWLTKEGLPPEGAPTPHVTPAPVSHTPAKVAPVAHGTVAPPPTKAAKPKSTSYVIRPGDTLTSISRRYNVPVSRIVSTNGIHNPNHIVAGARLTIPVG